jgi:tetratricopeptide (TPR) repeat protein
MKLGRPSVILAKPLMQVLLLCGIVLAVYFPTVSAEVSLLDDQGMITSLSNSAAGLNLKELFLPRSQQGGYYRPLIMLSYELDKAIWDLAPTSMHLENILLHLLLALLVLWFGRMLFAGSTRQSSIAFVAALVFALHPLATESVNWISGRTDLLAGTFMFLGVCFFLVAHKRGNRFGKFVAILAIIVGGLAKETAFAGLMVLPLMLAGVQSGNYLPTIRQHRKTLLWFVISAFSVIFVALFTYNYLIVAGLIVSAFVYYLWKFKSSDANPFRLKRDTFAIAGFAVLGFALFWFLRKWAFASNISRIGQTFKLMLGDINYTIHLFSGALAFYVKKCILPLPLNLAIREIDPVYSLFGGVIVLAVLILAVHRSLFSSLVLSGFVFLIPVLPFTLGTIAWTAYAERYVYLAIPFWVLALGCCYADRKETAGAVLKASVCLVVLTFAIVTYQRSLVWQTNLSLFADTVEKAPKLKIVRGLYMSALCREKMYEEAIQQYKIAQTLPELGYDDRFDLQYANILGKLGKRDQELERYMFVLHKTKGGSTGALRGLIGYNEYQLSEKKCRLDDCLPKIADYAKQLAAITDDPYDYYMLGKIYGRLGNHQAAVKNFNIALSHKGIDAGIASAIHNLISRYGSLE